MGLRLVKSDMTSGTSLSASVVAVSPVVCTDCTQFPPYCYKPIGYGCFARPLNVFLTTANSSENVCDSFSFPPVCEEHVTNGPDAHRIFPLRRMLASSSELSLSVRAMVSASVVYYTAPVKQTPRLTVSRQSRVNHGTSARSEMPRKSITTIKAIQNGPILNLIIRHRESAGRSSEEQKFYVFNKKLAIKINILFL